MSAASPHLHGQENEGRVRVLAPDGTYIQRVTHEQADELLAAGLAEWRGRDLRMVEMGGAQLDGLHVQRHSDGVKNCYGFTRRMMPVEGRTR